VSADFNPTIGRYHAPVRPDPKKAPPADLTHLLAEGRRDEIFELVYTELHAIALGAMKKERADHSLQATGLVHEVYVRLQGDSRASWPSRAAFFHAAGEAMRRILVEHARKRGAQKRGGGRARSPLSVADLAEMNDPREVVALDEAFVRLETEDPRAAEVVRLRFFAGLSVDQTAEAMGISRRTALREWEYARAWLKSELDDRKV